MASARYLERSEGAVRYKASHLGLKKDLNSAFFTDWQRRAANSKVGKTRPEQAAVMRKNHADGKMLKTPEQRKAMGVRRKAWIKKNGHPKGAKGMKHTDETKARISVMSKKRWANMTEGDVAEWVLKGAKTRQKNGTLYHDRPKASWKSGWRVFGRKRNYYRSRWEANYGRYLEWLKTLGEIKGWEHEPNTFWFKGVKRGSVSYLPDFKVTNNDESTEYHEVKGWMDKRSKTKIKRMAKYHPDVKLVVIDKKLYMEIKKKVGAMIVGWEK